MSGEASRRTLLRGAAWTTPVLVAAIAVPLSVCDPTFIQVDGNNTHYVGGGVFR